MKRNMKKILSFTLLYFIASFCHAIIFADVEAYELMPIEFNRQVKIISEKVTINNFRTEVELEISCEDSADLEAKIICNPCGYGRSYTDMMIPKDFEIFEDGKKIDFFVLCEGKKHTPEEAFSIAGYNYRPSEIHFRLAPAKKPFALKLSYYNTSIIKLLEKWGYGFTLMNYRFASKESQTYANNLFWTSDFEKECDILRVNSENKEIYWTCEPPKDMIMVELVFDAGYMDLSYGDRFRLGGLDISENLIGYRHLFFLPKECLEILRNSFYAIHGYDFKNQHTSTQASRYVVLIR